MSFIRVKKILNKKTGQKYPYAYIVSNSWKGKKVRQKVKKYLGRVHYFSREERDFEKFIGGSLDKYLDANDEEKIIIDLVRWELVNHGFKEDGKLLVNNDCCFNNGKIFNKNRKDIALAFNDGLLCGYLLKKLLKFNYIGDEEERMYKFAKDFVELGVAVPKEVFIALWEKIN